MAEFSGTVLRTNKTVVVADAFGYGFPIRLENGCFDQWMAAVNSGQLDHRVVMVMNHGKDVNGLIAALDSAAAPLSFEIVQSGPDEVLRWKADIPTDKTATAAQVAFAEMLNQGLVGQVSGGWKVKRYEWEEDGEHDMVQVNMEIDIDEVAVVWMGAFREDSIIDPPSQSAPGDHRKRRGEETSDAEPAMVAAVADEAPTRIAGDPDADIRIEGSHVIGAWDARAEMEAARAKMRAKPKAPEAKIIDAGAVDAVLADTRGTA